MTIRTRPKQGQKKDADASSSRLAAEIATYEAHFPTWTDRQGEFVLIKGREVHGFFARYEDALEAGYDQFEESPFLVEQILMYEPIYQLGQVEL